MQLKKEKSCGCIIIDNNKVLLIYEKNANFWGFPKGHMEDNETEIDTALREVKEETGLDVIINKDKRYILNYNIDNKINKTTVLYIATPLNSNLQLQESEISDAKWCYFDEAISLLTFDDWIKVFQEAINSIKN